MTDAAVMWGAAPWERVAPTMAAIHDRLVRARDPRPACDGSTLAPARVRSLRAPLVPALA